MTVTGVVVAPDGATLATQTWTFHTEAGGVARPTSLFAAQTPGDRCGRRPGAVELGTVVHAVGQRPGHRDPVLQGRRQHRHAHGLDLVDHAAPGWRTVTFTSETATGWQTLDLRRRRSTLTAGQTYVVVVLRAQRPLRRRRRVLRQPVTQGPLTAPAAQRPLRLRRRRWVPDELVEQHQLLRGRGLPELRAEPTPCRPDRYRPPGPSRLEV